MADTEPTGRREDDGSVFAGLPQMAQVVGQFVAPATLLAGLLFYWGFFHARGFCGYFGIDSAVLGLSTTDYVMRSADGLFVPLAVCAIATLAVLWGWVALPSSVRQGRWPRWFLPVVVVVGGLLVLNGLSRLWFRTWINRPLGVAPSCVIIGLLLMWGVVVSRRRRLATESATTVRPTAPVEWGLIFLLVGGSFFWGATDYSLAVGRGRAIEFEKETLRRAPGLTVYTEKPLELNVAGVRRIACTDASAAYRYRYDGLVLVMTAGDNLVAVPRSWTHDQGTAIVLPHTGPGAVRLEFTAPYARTSPAVC
ncbi:hypothetical protein ACLMAJ_13825 [Nocardia sp. KC 131]|uniref:hypothetical protein n=1 Tax=Nocardia arseniciresistens TaxID=3392119 RepID=UPI00398E6A5B